MLKKDLFKIESEFYFELSIIEILYFENLTITINYS